MSTDDSPDRPRSTQESTEGPTGRTPSPGGSRVDPVSVAFEALTGPDERTYEPGAPDSDRPRNAWIASSGATVDPLAVTREALTAEDESMARPEKGSENGSRQEPETGGPNLKDRLRSRFTRADTDSPTDSGAPKRRGDARRVLPKLSGRSGRTTPAPATPTSPAAAAADSSKDEGWVFHEAGSAGGFEGWLYHYADGTMSAEDGTVYKHSASGTITEPTQEPEPQSPSEPQPEPEPVPDSAPASADTDEPGKPEAPEAPEVPAFIEYSPSELPSYALATVLVLSSVAAVLTLLFTAEEPTSAGFVVAATLGVVAVAAYWSLVGWPPTVVTIRDGILEVSRGRREDRFDLRDPATRVDLGDQPGSRSWKARFSHPDGSTAVVGAQQVRARQFIQIVRYHRDRLRDPGAGN